MNFEYYFLCLILPCFEINEILSLPTESIQNNKINAVDKIIQMCELYKTYRWKNDSVPNPQIGGPPFLPRTAFDCVEQEPLIVKGTDAVPKEFPHMALVGYGEKLEEVQWKCGGSLISERFVLSAAHCNHRTGTSKPKWIRLGEHDLKSKVKGKEDSRDYKIIEIRDNPHYDSKKSYNDITLYKLDKNVNFNAFIRPLCLYPYDRLQNNTGKIYITGWGTNKTDGDRLNVLQKALVRIVDTKKCETTFNKKVAKFSDGFKSALQLCAGDLNNGSDTCQGDSGGPLQILIPNEKCMFYQIGITSIGTTNCGDKTNPGVYTNVGKYLDWIQGSVWPN